MQFCCAQKLCFWISTNPYVSLRLWKDFWISNFFKYVITLQEQVCDLVPLLIFRICALDSRLKTQRYFLNPLFFSILIVEFDTFEIKYWNILEFFLDTIFNFDITRIYEISILIFRMTQIMSFSILIFLWLKLSLSPHQFNFHSCS